MTTFEYLSVFISIVVGLGVVHVLGGVGMLLNRRAERTYWVHTTWVVFLVFWLPYFWWFTFDWRRVDTWTFPLFMFVVAYAMLSYLVTVVLVPTDPPDVADLEAYFFRVRPRFFMLLVLMNFADLLDAFLKPGNLADLGSTYLPVMAFLTLGHAVAALTDDRRVQGTWVVTHAACVVGFGLGIWADVFSRS